MGNRPAFRQKPLPLPGWLLAPLFIISVTLHILILAVPWSSRPSASVEETVETEASTEPEVVDILSIATQVPPETSPEDSAPPPPQGTQPVPPPSALPPNPDRLSPESAPADPADPADPPPEDTFQATTTDPPAPAFDPGAAQNDFAVNIGNVGVADYTDRLGLPPRRNFRNPATADQFLVNPDSDSPTSPPNARLARWLDKEPDTILQQLTGTYGATLDFAELPLYHNERFFVALEKQSGNPAFYLSLVQLQGSTLMVMWNSPPPGASL